MTSVNKTCTHSSFAAYAAARLASFFCFRFRDRASGAFPEISAWKEALPEAETCECFLGIIGSSLHFSKDPAKDESVVYEPSGPEPPALVWLSDPFSRFLRFLALLGSSIDVSSTELLFC